jgi:hypothetical protein
MKTLHIILIIGLCNRIHAQQSVTYNLESDGADLNITTHYDLSYNRTASWYVSTDPVAQLTTILFMDKNKQVIYVENLSRQFVELTTKNRRVLDNILYQLTHHKLATSKLKIKPFPLAQPGISDPLSESISGDLHPEAAAHGPSGIQTRVLLVNKKLLYVWMRAPAREKVTLLIKDHFGKTVRLHTVKTNQFTDSLPLGNLPDDNYQVRFYGKAWEKSYELQISREYGKMVPKLISR